MARACVRKAGTRCPRLAHKVIEKLYERPHIAAIAVIQTPRLFKLQRVLGGSGRGYAARTGFACACGTSG